jgi:hypothetical protein
VRQAAKGQVVGVQFAHEGQEHGLSVREGCIESQSASCRT